MAMNDGLFIAKEVVGTFPLTPNPPAGVCYFGVDAADGHFKIQRSNGSVIDLNSGASYNDASAVAAIQAAIQAASLKENASMDDYVYAFDAEAISPAPQWKRIKKIDLLTGDTDRLFILTSDFIGTISGEFTQTVSGTGASFQNVIYGQDAINRAIGVTQGDTGTTSTGRAGLGLVAATLLSPGLAEYKHSTRLAIEALSSVTDTFSARVGLGDFYLGAGNGTNGLFFSYTDLVNGGKWLIEARIAGTLVFSIDTGVALDLDMHVFDVILSEDNQLATFKIDGVVVGTLTPPYLPGLANRMGAGFKIEKTLGVSTRNMSADWMLLQIKRSSMR